jgi:hypothetical protein
MNKVELLRGIARKRVFLLANSAHLVPLSLLSVLSLFPILLRKRLIGWIFKKMRFGQGRQRATMRVTNLGALEVANAGGSDKNILGGAQIERSYFFPAAIRKVPSLVFFTCNKKVYLSLAALTSTFSYESGKEFLGLLVRELHEF